MLYNSTDTTYNLFQLISIVLRYKRLMILTQLSKDITPFETSQDTSLEWRALEFKIIVRHTRSKYLHTYAFLYLYY